VILIHLARRFGIGFVVPSIIAREMKDRDLAGRAFGALAGAGL
jgi:hypothetical protein